MSAQSTDNVTARHAKNLFKTNCNLSFVLPCVSRRVGTIEADVRAEVAVEVQEQLVQIHQNYQTCLIEQATTTQKKCVR